MPPLQSFSRASIGASTQSLSLPANSLSQAYFSVFNFFSIPLEMGRIHYNSTSPQGSWGVGQSPPWGCPNLALKHRGVNSHLPRDREMATAAGGHLPAEKLYGKERSCVPLLKTWQGRNMSVRMDRGK